MHNVPSYGLTLYGDMSAPKSNEASAVVLVSNYAAVRYPTELAASMRMYAYPVRELA